MRKKPIDSLERFYKEMHENSMHDAQIITFNSKKLKTLLREGYNIESLSELWYDEQGLDYNNWIDEYGDGIWFMTQKDVDKMVIQDTVRKFSRLTRRAGQKVIPRAFKSIMSDDCISIYLYMRDRIKCDYVIYLRKRIRGGFYDGIPFRDGDSHDQQTL